MEKFTIEEASNILGISKEAVYNRIRRNTVDFIIEEGQKYVMLDKNTHIKQEKSLQNSPTKPQNSFKNSTSDKYEACLLAQIDELKQKIEKLENDKDELIKQKEEILVHSRNEVERIYQNRDKELRQILAIITKPILSLAKKGSVIEAPFEELSPYEKDLIQTPSLPNEEEQENAQDEWISAREYMNEKGYSYKKKRKIGEALLAIKDTNDKVKDENGMIYIKKGYKIKQIIKEQE